jgi:hypothetical protein
MHLGIRSHISTALIEFKRFRNELDMTHFIRALLDSLRLAGSGSCLQLKRANALACPQMLSSAEESDIQTNEYILKQRAMVIHIQQSEHRAGGQRSKNGIRTLHQDIIIP